MPSVAAIVLAAGASVRLGQPKQLVRLAGETLLDRAIRVAIEAGLDPVLCVISPDFRTQALPASVTAVLNHEATEGMASSIREGLRALALSGRNVAGAVFLACDQPAVTPAHLRELALGDDKLVASAYAGRKGIPAYFPRQAFEVLQTLHGDTGARDLLQKSRTITLPGGEIDVDTVEDLKLIRKLYGS